MRDLVRRLEQLERTAQPVASVFLIGWQGEPRTAKHGGEVIEREATETADAFKARAAERFQPAQGVAAVWIE